MHTGILIDMMCKTMNGHFHKALTIDGAHARMIGKEAILLKVRSKLCPVKMFVYKEFEGHFSVF